MPPKDLFHKKKQDKPDDGIVILKKTEPGMCGGTDASQDTKAPKEILSEDMILFDVTSALSRGYIPSEGKRNSGQGSEGSASTKTTAGEELVKKAKRLEG